MALDPEVKKEIDGLNANLLSLKEELAAIKKIPHTAEEIKAIKDQISGVIGEISDLKKSGAPKAPKDPPEVPVEESQEFPWGGFW